MLEIEQKVAVIEGCRPDAIAQEILQSSEPVIMKGLVADWPIVQIGLESADQATDYLLRFYRGEPVVATVGAPEIKGRVFYNDDLTGFNHQNIKLDLHDFFKQLIQLKGEANAPTLYMGSTLVDKWLPGFRDDNDLGINDLNPLVSVWIGNQSRISAHYDVPNNIACAVLGRRRFTLFPPEQLDNLYVGPLELTPSGLPISLVDIDDPDFERFPRFREALKAARVADLEPGDALFLPSMWWHHVASLDQVNALVNYWWRSTPDYMGTPLTVLQHALLTIGAMTPEQRRAWRHIFDYYVFEPEDGALDHIPEHARGSLGGVDEITARKIRAQLLNRLNQ